MALVLSILISSILVSFICRRQRHHYVIWKEVATYTNSLLHQHRLLRTPPLPAPPRDLLNDAETEAEEPFEYAELDTMRWPLPARCLRLEERIAVGSYGDVFKGMLILPTRRNKRKHMKHKVESRQIVAKMLNGGFASYDLVTTYSVIKLC